MTTAGITAIASALPERVVSNEEMEARLGLEPGWIARRTGIQRRRIAAPGCSTADMAVAAAEAVLAQAGAAAADLDMIIVTSSSPDTFFPSVASVVQGRLAATQAAAFDLSAACSGFIYGLVVAEKMITTGTCEQILLVGAETLNRLINWDDPDTAALFGDGAAAALITPVAQGRGIMAADLGSDGSRREALLVKDQLDGAYIVMDGRAVFRFAVKQLPDSINLVLQKLEMGMDAIDLIVPHQANDRILKAAARRLGIDPGLMVSTIADYGNTSTASVPMALVDAVLNGRLHDGDTIILTGFGAGLSWASMAMDWGPLVAPPARVIVPAPSAATTMTPPAAAGS